MDGSTYIAPVALLETKPEIEPWRQVLLDAADRMEVRGHCKYMLVDDEGRNCAQGAIFDFRVGESGSWDNFLNGDAFTTAATKFNDWVEMQHHSGGTVTWNNSPQTTGAEVIAALRACALS